MSSVLENLVNQPYKHGFVTDIESDTAPKGLNEDTIRFISAKKNEPEWLLEFRLKAYRHWLTMAEPKWPRTALSSAAVKNASITGVGSRALVTQGVISRTVPTDMRATNDSTKSWA